MPNAVAPSARAAAALALAALALLAGCATSSTGRSQFIAVSDAQMDQLGATSFERMKQSDKLSRDPRRLATAQCVVDALSNERLVRRELAFHVSRFLYVRSDLVVIGLRIDLGAACKKAASPYKRGHTPS